MHLIWQWCGRKVLEGGRAEEEVDEEEKEEEKRGRYPQKVADASVLIKR